jgi:hypothetical protein
MSQDVRTGIEVVRQVYDAWSDGEPSRAFL